MPKPILVAQQDYGNYDIQTGEARAELEVPDYFPGGKYKLHPDQDGGCRVETCALSILPILGTH